MDKFEIHPFLPFLRDLDLVSPHFGPITRERAKKYTLRNGISFPEES